MIDFERVISPKANCKGSMSQKRSRCSNQTSETSAACWVFSTSSRRVALESPERADDVAAFRDKRLDTARSHPPSPASCPSRWRNAPSPWRRREARHGRPSSSARCGSSGSCRHSERLVMSLWPSSSSAKIAFQEARRGRLVHSVEAGLHIGVGIGLDHPGRMAGFILVAMGDEDAVLGLA